MTKVDMKYDRPLLLVELNEVNFDIVRLYVEGEPGRYPSLERLMSSSPRISQSESDYENLEPWIQWVSVHTGQAFREHKVFRLGDIVHSGAEQIFERLEGRGVKVGCISPMNAANRLKSPAYFLPDPWTETPTDNSWSSRVLARALSQAVNDNASAKLTLGTILVLLLGLAVSTQPRNWLCYFSLALRSRGAPWRKALFLDLFLSDLHIKKFKRSNVDFSTVFFNAGAHIQHHYLLNSKVQKPSEEAKNPDWYVGQETDPFAEMLQIYDRIIGSLFELRDAEMIVATGLTQVPYDRVKFYYRLKDHELFLKGLGLRFKSVAPRMTRDFLVEFEQRTDLEKAIAVLSGIVCQQTGLKVFAEYEDRGSSLFVTLTYPHEIQKNAEFMLQGKPIRLAPHVAFVAIKNGMHNGKGYMFFTPGVAIHAPQSGGHIRNLFNTLDSYFRTQ